MADHSPLNVLVVEDDVDIAETLKDFLDGHGYSVSCMASGEAALQDLRPGRHTDIMLVDFTLSSRMTGVELLEICAADAALARVPVILMTGFPAEHFRAGLRCPVLTKPFALGQVLAALTAATKVEARPTV